eukprot:maker-scaffold_7-snap-gene-13.16-mRNA-1 protein AED:0.00 eAED:0.01 QI:0/0/0/1/1/1/2/0/950
MTIDPFKDLKVKKSAAIVSIKMYFPRDFGTNEASSSQATGFVVNKEKGLILTNKHVVSEGPVKARAEFWKHEDIDLVPVYRDPVHDFGFFRFDPAKLKETELTEIELYPEGAVKGNKVLVVGNSAGEKLSFVESTLSQIDRLPPSSLDLNTFYITSSNTSVGGSSGGPHLDSHGRAVCMNAAETYGNIKLGLPLYRVKRALEFIEKGEKPPRGTLQVGFKYLTFENLKKSRDLSVEIVEKVQSAHKKAEGMLVVEKTLKDGPGAVAGLMNGDILLQCNNSYVQQYIQLADIFDTYVGNKINIRVLRENEEVELEAVIQDLSELENFRFVEVSNGIVHGMDYLLCMDYNISVKGVMISKPGYMFSKLPFYAIIKKIGTEEIENLDDFISMMQRLQNSKLVAVKYQPIEDPTRTVIETCSVDKLWFPFELATRDDDKGIWKYQSLNNDNKLTSMKTKMKTSKQSPGDTSDSTRRKSLGLNPSHLENELENSQYARCLVVVSIDMPYSLDSDEEPTKTILPGIILDKNLGIVLTGSTEIKHTIVDAAITFEGIKKISAKVLYIDPILNIVFLQYKVQDLKEDDEENLINPISLPLASSAPKAKDTLTYIGVYSRWQIYVQEVKVRGMKDSISHSYYGAHSCPDPPYESLILSKGSRDGIYLNKAKEIAAFCVETGETRTCTRTKIIFESIRGAILKDDFVAIPSTKRALPIAISYNTFESATYSFGLPNSWTKKLLKTITIFDRKLLRIGRRMVGQEAFDKLKENDVILALNGEPVTQIKTYFDLTLEKERVDLTILREGDVFDVSVQTYPFSTKGATHLIHFCGLTFQEIPDGVKYYSSEEVIESGGVFVASELPGSPAEAASLDDPEDNTTSSIVGKILFKIGIVEVSSLDQVIDAVRSYNNNEFIRLGAKHMKTGEVSFHDIKLDLEYWKTREMRLEENNNWSTTIRQGY